MLCKRIRSRKNAAAHSKPDPLSRLGAGQRGEHPVEPAKPFGRNHAVASRHGRKRRIELDMRIEPASETAKTDDLGPY
jgi:hypothetical protein